MGYTLKHILFNIQTIANVVSGVIKVIFLISKLSFSGSYR